MRMYDFSDKTYIEIPVEQNPAFAWAELVDPVKRGSHHPTVMRKEEAIMVYKVQNSPGHYMVTQVPLIGQIIPIAVFQCLHCAIMLCGAFINNPHKHESNE